MPPITDPALLAEIQRQQQTGSVPPAPPPADPGYKPYYTPKPQPFPSAKMTLPPRLQSSEHRQDAMLPSQVSNSQTEAELNKLRLREERIKQGLDPDTGEKPIGAGQIGEAALTGWSDADKAIVHSIIQGRGPNITAFAIAKNPQLMKYVQAAYAVEPGTDLTVFQRRSVAAQKFLANPNSPMLRVNQALQHLGLYAQNVNALHNAHSSFFTNPLNIDNYASMAYKKLSKDPQFEAAANDRDALATELAAAFQGGGTGGALADREEWKKRLSLANSPEGFDKSVREAVRLLGGRVEASNAQFKQAVGANADFYDLMSPGARKVYEKYAPDDAPIDPNDKEISTTSKTVEIPEQYQHDHAVMLSHHTPGTLTVGQYVQIRNALDEKDLPENMKSHLDPKEVQDFVDSYNGGSKKIKIPALNVPLSEEGIVPGTHFLSEKDRASAAASPLGTGLAAAANAGSFGLVEGTMGQENRDKLHMMEDAHPNYAMGGELLGSVPAMAGLEKGGISLLEKIAPNLTVTARKKLLGDIAVNSAYGADRGFMGADEGQGAKGAAKGAGAGAIAAGAGNFALKGLNPLLSDATSSALSKMKGVDMTTLQRLGLGKAEEGFSGVPLAHGARKASLQSFNLDFANQGLKYIGGKLPKGLQPGTEVNAEVNKQLNAAYNEIRPQIAGAADGQFVNGITAIQAGANTTEKKAMFGEIKDALDKFTDPETGHYNGQGYKEASERLRYLAKTWSNKEGDVAAGDMARAAEQTRKQMQTLIQRQTPEVGAKLKNIERGWAHSVLVEDASNRALAAGEGVASPGQVLTSIKKLDTSARKGASARGKAFGQPYAQAAAKTLGSGGVPKVSIRETAYVLAGIGATGYTAPAALPIVSGMAVGAYGPGVKRAVQVILSGKRPTAVDNQIVRRALEDAIRHKATGN